MVVGEHEEVVDVDLSPCSGTRGGMLLTLLIRKLKEYRTLGLGGGFRVRKLLMQDLKFKGRVHTGIGFH